MLLGLAPARLITSRTHDVIARVNEEDFTCNGASIRTAQEECSIPHFALLDVAAQWRCYAHVFAEAGEAPYPPGCQRVEPPPRNGIHANLEFPKLKGKGAHPALQGGFA